MTHADNEWPEHDAVHLTRMSTPAGQCVAAFYAGLGGTWSLPEEGPGVIERAAAGDGDARALAMRGAAVLGASPSTIELVIQALADAKELAADEESQVTVPLVLTFLVPSLADTFYPNVDIEQFMHKLLKLRSLDFYLLNRVNGCDQPRPADGDASALHDFALTAPLLPPDRIGERPLRWVGEQQALWLERTLGAIQSRNSD